MLTANDPNVLERILLAGPFGSGKSHNWLTIARLALQTKSPAKFYVIDTDNAIDFTLRTKDEFKPLLAENGGNVMIFSPMDWDSYVEAIEAITKAVTPIDWIIWDRIDPLWSWVQNFYTQKRYGKNRADFFLEWRLKKGSGKGNEYEGDTEWPVIKSLYAEYVSTPVIRAQCHVFVTVGAKPTSDRDDKKIQQIWGPYSMRAEGNKETGFLFHTIFLVEEKKPDTYQIITVRERGSRNKFVGEDWTGKSFALAYLVKEAGWKL